MDGIITVAMSNQINLILRNVQSNQMNNNVKKDDDLIIFL